MHTHNNTAISGQTITSTEQNMTQKIFNSVSSSDWQVQIVDSKIENFILTIKGVIYNQKKPGLPALVEMLKNGRVVDRFFVKTMADSNLYAKGTFSFTRTVYISENELNDDIHLHILELNKVVYETSFRCEIHRQQEQKNTKQAFKANQNKNAPVQVKAEKKDSCQILPAKQYHNYEYLCNNLTQLHSTHFISVIILNHNGAELLQDLLTSALQIQIKNIEWIIVDHNSIDSSLQVCQKFQRNGLTIRCFSRRQNYTFSESNNYASQYAKGDILIFANNDLIFLDTFFEQICAVLEDEAIGCVGCRLLDYSNTRTNSSIQHLGVFFKTSLEQFWIRAFDGRLSNDLLPLNNIMAQVPCVTGAFLAIRKKDFFAVNKFDEHYIYGLEDIDLCLKIRFFLKKSIISLNNLSIMHRCGYTRNQYVNHLKNQNNNFYLNKKWSVHLKHTIKSEHLHQKICWQGRRTIIGFIVEEVSDQSSTGDYYTALEFGRAVQKLVPVHLKFIPREHWYDLHDLDILICMRKVFDLTKIKRVNPFMLTINWLRQSFDTWVEDTSLYLYDFLFVTSQIAQKFVYEKTGRKAFILRIASNFSTFSQGHYEETLACDYCFTGSYFNVARDIQYCLQPETIQGKGAVFGYHWEQTNLQQLYKEALAYSKMPDVYASTKVVIDDANFTTNSWGSCNSRIFDALAAGTLVVTNGQNGVREIFGDLVPTWHDSHSLTDTLNYWLTHDNERQTRSKILQDKVCQEHTYDVRAKEFLQVFETAKMPLRIAIKCPALLAEKEKWGDYYFCKALANEFIKLGYIAHLDFYEQWYNAYCDLDHIVIVMRGLKSYLCRGHQMNIMWLISHANDVPISEYTDYDLVFCASKYHSKVLSSILKRKIIFLPQCTDITKFYFQDDIVKSKPERILFVGNSRGIHRTFVQWSQEQHIDLDLYGKDWEFFVDSKYIKGTYIPNNILSGFYGSSGCVLCDHWEDMKNLGYISNRVYDVLASGGIAIVDDVYGLTDLPETSYFVCKKPQELRNLIQQAQAVSSTQRKEIAEFIAGRHSFANRAKVIHKELSRLVRIQN